MEIILNNMGTQTLKQLAEMLNNGLSMEEAQPIIKQNNWVQLDFIYDVDAKQRLIKIDGEYIVEDTLLSKVDTYYILTDNWHRTKAFSYEDKFNDETGERIEKYTTDGVNPEWKESSLPTLNEMIKAGTARKIDLLQVIDIYDVSSPEEAREKALKKQQKEAQRNQSGVFNGVKYIFANKDTKMLIIAHIIFDAAMPAIALYFESAMNQAGMSTSETTKALFMVPVVYASITFLSGILADKAGRKATVTLFSTTCVIGYILFVAVSISSSVASS